MGTRWRGALTTGARLNSGRARRPAGVSPRRYARRGAEAMLCGSPHTHQAVYHTAAAGVEAISPWEAGFAIGMAADGGLLPELTTRVWVVMGRRDTGRAPVVTSVHPPLSQQARARQPHSVALWASTGLRVVGLPSQSHSRMHGVSAGWFARLSDPRDRPSARGADWVCGVGWCLQYHQFQVVGRHSPTEADATPKVYRMKLWALDATRARSKFWCALCQPRLSTTQSPALDMC
jgi:hypothetical protein